MAKGELIAHRKKPLIIAVSTILKEFESVKTGLLTYGGLFLLHPGRIHFIFVSQARPKGKIC